ncbi:MAG: hypothetical protein HOO67_07225 [Candidatus Peribacteraceae bacterium]|nr:hypothetical protein [Candidatus Peribacteraceae bacterium]
MKYSKSYIATLEKEAAALRKAYREGKIKGYSSAKELFDDILGRKPTKQTRSKKK